MGSNAYTLGSEDSPEYVEVVSHSKRIHGKCPMCGKEFDLIFNLLDGGSEYECLCGYFRFDAETNCFTEDNHGISQADWINRRKQAEAKLPPKETNENQEAEIHSETDLEDFLKTIKSQFPGVPDDQIGIYPDYDQDCGSFVMGKITIFRKKTST